MARLHFTPPAWRDLLAILSYVGADSPDRSRVFVGRIIDRCTVLEQYPLAGRPRVDLYHVDPGMRSLSVKPLIVFYRHVGDRVEVLRIVDGRRDLRTVFPEDI